jgi:two-component system LytT family response regulator
MDCIYLKKKIKKKKEKYFIKSNLKNLKVFTSKIKWIEAFGDYVKVVTDEDSNLYFLL